MNTEKIYILVPVYKTEPYIERCINSILNQTYTNWVLVLVNDGSPDNSGKICDHYATKYENIKVIHLDHSGVSVARNTAIEFALENGNPEHDWFSFIDSDDYVHPRYLEYLYQAARAAGTNISGCGYLRTTSQEIDASAIHNIRFSCISTERYWCKQCGTAIGATAKLYRLHLIRDVRFPVNKIFEDTFATHKILFLCDKIAFTKEALYYWYANENSITTSQWTPKRIDLLDAAEAQYADLKANGFSRASKRCARYLFWCNIKTLIFVQRLSPTYDYLIPELEARRKKALKIYAKEVGRIPALCYWLIVQHLAPAGRRLKRKIRKLMHSR